MEISPEMHEIFEENGFLIIEDFLPAELNQLLKNEIDNIKNNFKNLPERLQRELLFEKDLSQKQRGEISPEECGNAIFLISELPRFGDIFKNLLRYEPLLDVLEALFKSTEFEYHFSNVTIKSARVGSKISWHRDCNNKYMQCLTPDMMRPMLCLDGMTAENGATQIVRNSHKVTDEFAMNDRAYREENWKKDDVITLECAPGSLVILHSKIVHGGFPNRSANSRRNIIFQFGGEENFLISPEREIYTGILPRSKNPQRMKQNEIVFKDLTR
jgi:ectoine hydroxylase-related dioxygenase (phytanoyl-CoA dioxygenase family)